MVRTVSPADARAWIRHSHQRNTDLFKCRRMLDDLESGRWDVARQKDTPVIVSNGKGCIADGHHRLVTILLWGEPLECEVIFRD